MLFTSRIFREIKPNLNCFMQSFIWWRCIVHCMVISNTVRYNKQFSLELYNNGKDSLVYCELWMSIAKDKPNCSQSKSQIVHMYTASDEWRCLIALFKKYVRLPPCSESGKKLYVLCEKSYCDQPYGINEIKTTVKDIYKQGVWLETSPFTEGCVSRITCVL